MLIIEFHEKISSINFQNFISYQHVVTGLPPSNTHFSKQNFLSNYSSNWIQFIVEIYLDN